MTRILEFFVVKAPNPKDMVKDRDETQTNISRGSSLKRGCL